MAFSSTRLISSAASWVQALLLLLLSSSLFFQKGKGLDKWKLFSRVIMPKWLVRVICENCFFFLSIYVSNDTFFFFFCWKMNTVVPIIKGAYVSFQDPQRIPETWSSTEATLCILCFSYMYKPMIKFNL